MTSTSLRELPCLKELEGGENDSKIGSEAVEKILNELLMELDKSQVNSTRIYLQYNLAFRMNWNRRGSEIYRKLKK